MKQRLSFVTNSSSSSFILAVKDGGFLSSGTSSLEKLVKGIVFGNADVIKTKEELDEWFLDNNGPCGISSLEVLLECDNGYYRESYEEYLEFINKGYFIVEREVDNNEETMIDLINQMPDNENIIMIRGEC